MTSMTMVGGLVSPAPQWRLGEMGELLREHMNTKIESLDQLTLYMQRNDADMLYGGRILAQIDAILDDLRRNGISRDLAVAVESARPGTIPKNVQSILTSNYTRTHQKETIAALESWQEAGKIGLLVLLVTAVLKILSWLMNNGGDYKGPSEGSGPMSPEAISAGREAMQKLQTSIPTVAAKAPPSKQSESEATMKMLKSSAVLDAYQRALKSNPKGAITARLDVCALKLDKILDKVKGREAVDWRSLVIGQSIFNRLFSTIMDGRGNASNVTEMAVESLLTECHVGDAVFASKACGKLYALLPDDLRKAGIRLPCESTFRVANNQFGEFDAYFDSMVRTFNKLRTVEWKSYDETSFGKLYSQFFGDSIRIINDLMATIIPDVSGKGMSYDTAPSVAMTEQQASTLIGYGDPIQFVGGKVLVTAGYESYLNASSWMLIKEKLKLNESQLEALLGACCAMTDTTVCATARGIIHIDGYRALEQKAEKMVKAIEEWQKQLKTQGVDVNWVARVITGAATEQRSDSLNLGREISMDLQDGDFFATLRRHMTFVRQIARGIVAMNRCAQGSKRNVTYKNIKE